MNSKNDKKDNTVLTEILNLPLGDNEKTKVIDDPQNQKVQKKFDEAFKDNLFSDNDGLDFLANEATESKAKSLPSSPPADDIHIEFDGSDFDPLADLHNDATTIATNHTKNTHVENSDPLGGMDLDFSNGTGLKIGDELPPVDHDEAKTTIMSTAGLDFNMEEAIGHVITDKNDHNSITSADLISGSEARVNIEQTIANIIRPKSEQASSPKLDATSANAAPKDEPFELDFTGVDEIDTNKTKMMGAPSNNIDDNLFDVDVMQAVNTEVTEKTNSRHSFDGSSFKNNENKSVQANGKSNNISNESINNQDEGSHSKTNISDDEYIRLQSTIRMLREEREGILANVKDLKSTLREFEQDNLTLKAALDEVKIEVSILRKRHSSEIEDYKYRFNLSEEKRNLAEEKMKQLERLKEKLENKSRIDVSQVRQREKELESKLELLSMDVDSQVNSRDTKILELRRKIDSLEFNMENATIREQKSTDDKRKLEEKLNKIMKTLRHSIKNLEDDIESQTEEHMRMEKEK